VTLDQQSWQDRLDTLADKHGVVGASLAVRHGDHDGRGRDRGAHLSLPAAGDPRRAVPDRLHHQGLDRDPGHAARRRGPARPGRARRPPPARLPGGGRARLGDGDRPAAARPHQRHRRRPVPRHRSRRRRRREVRRGHGGADAGAPAGRDDVVLQLRLHAARSAGRGAAGQTWDAALREHLLAPLGLATAGTLPEEALLHAAAAGHVVPQPGADRSSHRSGASSAPPARPG
jgi:hypothetical protein